MMPNIHNLEWPIGQLEKVTEMLYHLQTIAERVQF